MKKFLATGLVAIAAIACSHKTTAPAASAPAAAEPIKTTTAAAAPAVDANVEAGHQVYTAKCGRCHGLKEPSNYTAARWEPILQSMAPKARLSEQETAQVRAYVQANAKKS